MPDQLLHEIQEELQGIEFGPEVEKAMIGERALMVNMFRYPDALYDENPIAKVERVLPREDDQLKYLEFMKQLIAASRLRGVKRFNAGEKCAAEFNSSMNQVGSIIRVRYSCITRLLAGSQLFFTIAAKGEARTRTAATWIAVERFRRQHGRLPQNLAELVPEFIAKIPEDPFDGNPL